MNVARALVVVFALIASTGAAAPAQSSMRYDLRGPHPLVGFDIWGEFIRSSSVIVSPHTTDTVVIERATTGAWPNASNEAWVLERTTETLRDPHRGVVTKRWADSRSCPALIPTLAKLADLEPIAIQPPGRPYPTGDLDAPSAEALRRNSALADRQIFDGGTYFLHARGHRVAARMVGEVSMQSGAGTPVAAWIEQAFAALEPCWEPTQPMG